MKLLCFLLVACSASSELLIAVPDSSFPQQQTFQATFINQVPPTITPRQDFVPQQLLQNQNPNIEIHQFEAPNLAIDKLDNSRSFEMLKQTGDTLGIARRDKDGLTITIKLDGNQIAGLRGQGSNPKATFEQVPRSTSNYVQQTSSLAEVLHDGLQSVNPFKSTAQTPLASSSHAQIQYQDAVTDVPLTESNGFLKSMTNLIKSQISSLMDSPAQSHSQWRYTQPQESPAQTLPYQNFAIFTPLSTQPPKQPQNIRQNVADFLTQKFPSVNSQSNKLNPNLQIAIPQNNQLQQGGFAYAPTESPYEEESPIRSAASTILKSVSNIPSNLDAMFLDMGRVYRENLFSLRDKLSDMKSLMPGMLSTPVNKNKEATEPWLDGFGA